MSEYQNLEIGTILSNRDERARVELKINDKIISQWDISKAREIHRMLGEAIEAAISDELIFRYLTERVGASKENALRALMDFREIRQGSNGTVFPS